MKNLKILIGNDISIQGVKLANMLINEGAYVAIWKTSSEAISTYLSSSVPDILIIEEQMGDMTASQVMKDLMKIKLPALPSVLVICEAYNNDTENELRNLGVKATLRRPFDFDVLLNIINSLNDPAEYDVGLEYLVASVLDQIGIPGHLIGYEYLKYVLMESVNNPGIFAYGTMFTYAKVAEHYGITPYRVERAIRYGIEKAINYGDFESMYKWRGNGVSPDNGKPTNTQFIRSVLNKLRLHISLETKASATTIN